MMFIVGLADTPSANAIVTRRRSRHDRTPSFFTMSNSPLRGLTAQPISFPRRVGAPGLVRRLALSPPSPPHLRCRCRRFGGRARRNLGDSIASGPEMRGPAERREAHYLLSRS